MATTEKKNIDQINREVDFENLDGSERFVGRDDSGDFKTVIPFDKMQPRDSINTSLFLQIDGDFNFWNRGVTSTSTDNTYLTDFWELSTSGDTATLQQGVHSATNSKPYYMTFRYTDGDFQRIQCAWKGNILSGKTLKVFIKIRKNISYSAPKANDNFIQFVGGVTSLSNQTIDLSGLTTSWEWKVYDATLLNYNETFVRLRIGHNTGTDSGDEKAFDIDKIRIVESSLLQGVTGTPEWIKADEDRDVMKMKVQQYYRKLLTASSNRSTYMGYLDTTTQFEQELPFEFVQVPTVTKSGNISILDSTGTALAISSISAISTNSGGTLLDYTTAAGTVGYGVVRFTGSSSTAYIEFDAAY